MPAAKGSQNCILPNDTMLHFLANMHATTCFLKSELFLRYLSHFSQYLGYWLLTGFKIVSIIRQFIRDFFNRTSLTINLWGGKTQKCTYFSLPNSSLKTTLSLKPVSQTRYHLMQADKLLTRLVAAIGTRPVNMKCCIFRNGAEKYDTERLNVKA